MECFRYDRSSKWMIEHQGRLILYLGRIHDVEECRTSQTEVVQPRKTPDGLLEVRRRGQQNFHPVIVEIETNPEKRTVDDLIDDVMLVYQNRRELPDVLVLVLRPKGKAEIANSMELRSEFGLTTLQANWRIVELWNLEASDLLATGEPGLMPWVSLTHIEGPIEPVLRECRRIIDEAAKPTEYENLLAVSQVLLDLNYNDPALFAIFGGREAMIESPMLNELVAEGVAKGIATRTANRVRRNILDILVKKFGAVPSDVTAILAAITDDERLDRLNVSAAVAPDLESFRRELGQ